MEVCTLNNDNFNELLKRYNAGHPQNVEGLNNTSYFYYFNKLKKMVFSIFEFENIPEEWNMPYFKEHLFLDGVICVTDTKAGVLPLMCGTKGVNWFNQPTDFIVHNVVLGNIEGKIGADGEIIFLSQSGNMFYSVIPLITRYATLLAEVDGSLQSTLINSRVAHIFYANSTAQLKTYQKMYDKITRGEPAVFIRKTSEDGQEALFNNVKSSYIGTELLDTKRTIMNEFLTEIGVNNANTDKRERLNADEVNANNQELDCNIYEWHYNLKNCIDNVNRMYNLNIKVSINNYGGGRDELQLDQSNELE